MPKPFQKGHTFSVGNKGPRRQSDFLTQELISQLHEIDPKRSNVEKRHVLAETLITMAIGGTMRIPFKAKNGKATQMRNVDFYPDLSAVKEIHDRVQGKPAQQVAVTGAPDGKSTGAREKLAALLLEETAKEEKAGATPTSH